MELLAGLNSEGLVCIWNYYKNLIIIIKAQLANSRPTVGGGKVFFTFTPNFYIAGSF